MHVVTAEGELVEQDLVESMPEYKGTAVFEAIEPLDDGSVVVWEKNNPGFVVARFHGPEAMSNAREFIRFATWSVHYGE